MRAARYARRALFVQAWFGGKIHVHVTGSKTDNEPEIWRSRPVAGALAASQPGRQSALIGGPSGGWHSRTPHSRAADPGRPGPGGAFRK